MIWVRLCLSVVVGNIMSQAPERTNSLNEQLLESVLIQIGCHSSQHVIPRVDEVLESTVVIAGLHLHVVSEFIQSTCFLFDFVVLV